MEQSCGLCLGTLTFPRVASCCTPFRRPSQLPADGGSLSECLMSREGEKWSFFYFGSSQFLGWLMRKKAALLISPSKIRL